MKKRRLKWNDPIRNSDLRPNVRDMAGLCAIIVIGYILAVLIMTLGR